MLHTLTKQPIFYEKPNQYKKLLFLFVFFCNVNVIIVRPYLTVWPSDSKKQNLDFITTPIPKLLPKKSRDQKNYKKNYKKKNG